MWIRSAGAFKAIVDVKLFYQAQGILLERQRRFSDEEMLDWLRHLYQRHGRLSGILIDDPEGMPSSAAYSNRFHGLIRAYRLIGYTPERDYHYIQINRFRIMGPHDPHAIEMPVVARKAFKFHHAHIRCMPPISVNWGKPDFAVNEFRKRCQGFPDVM